jgi:hypothetical protein
MACASIIEPKHVLELGCGLYSTPLFLDSRCFPSVQKLTSVETDDRWFQRIDSLLSGNPRWEPYLAETTVAVWLRSKEAEDAVRACDLIFVDDAAGVLERAGTLCELFSLNPLCPIVVHDVEQWRLRCQIWKRRPYVVFGAFSPQTAVCNCASGAAMVSLKRANAKLRACRDDALSTSTLSDWVTIGDAAIRHIRSPREG